MVPQGRHEVLDRIDRAIELGEVAADRGEVGGVAVAGGRHPMGPEQGLGPGPRLRRDVLADQLERVEYRAMRGDDRVEGLLPPEWVRGDDGTVVPPDDPQ